MAAQQFTLFKGTLAGTDSLFTEPMDLSWARTLTLRVRYISGVGTTPALTAKLQASPSPSAEDAGWPDVDATALSAGSGGPLAQETWEISAGTGADRAFSGFIRGEIALTGTDPVVTGEVHLMARD